MMNVFFFLQGLENMWAKQKEVTQVLYEGLERLGLELLVKDKVGEKIPVLVSGTLATLAILG